MKAKAKAKGFYQGRIIYPGEVFDVGQSDKAAWFDVLNAKALTVKAPKEPKKTKSSKAK